MLPKQGEHIVRTLACIVCLSIGVGSIPSIVAGQDKGVLLGKQIVSFEDALPVLSAMLDGSSAEKMEALDCLSYYGDTICGLSVFDKVCKIATEDIEFPATDNMLRLSREEQRARRKQPLNAAAQVESESFTMQSFALCIVANSSDDRSRALVEKFAKSASPAKRYMAEIVPSLMEFVQRSGRMRPGANMKALSRAVGAFTNESGQRVAVSGGARTGTLQKAVDTAKTCEVDAASMVQSSGQVSVIKPAGSIPSGSGTHRTSWRLLVTGAIFLSLAAVVSALIARRRIGRGLQRNAGQGSKDGGQ